MTSSLQYSTTDQLQQPTWQKQTNFRGTQRRFPPKYIEKSFQAIQSTFRSPEVQSKRRYKICICLVILRQLECFRNEKSFQSVLFSENLRCNLLKFFESQNFSDFSLLQIFESEKVRSPFPQKKLNLRSKMRKLKRTKIV